MLQPLKDVQNKREKLNFVNDSDMLQLKSKKDT